MNTLTETSPILFPGHDRLRARALFIGQRIDLKALEQAQRLASAPLVVTAGSSGCAVLFRYGVVVLLGLNAMEEVSFLAELRPYVHQPFDKPESEQMDLVTGDNEGVEIGQIVLRRFGVERLQLVSDVLAKSAVLSYYEISLAASFDRIEPLANQFQSGIGLGARGHELLRFIGNTLSTQAKMVGMVEVAEKPELLWEQPELERLYLRLEDEYELRERSLALERKLALISRTAETLLGLLDARRTLRVEWYIVILIVIEIGLTLYEMFG